MYIYPINIIISYIPLYILIVSYMIIVVTHHQEHDAQEFLTFLLDHLHEELVTINKQFELVQQKTMNIPTSYIR